MKKLKVFMAEPLTYSGWNGEPFVPHTGDVYIVKDLNGVKWLAIWFDNYGFECVQRVKE